MKHHSIADEFPDVDPLSLLGPAVLTTAYRKLRARAIRLEAASLRVAKLNPDAGEIGAGMLATIVEEAQAALKP